jgi:hypothetical protein
VNVCPAISAVPTLAGPAFGATASVTGPLPDPDAPEITVIQTAWDSAVQLQPDAALTLTVWLDAAAAAATVGGSMARLHGTGEGGATPS